MELLNRDWADILEFTQKMFTVYCFVADTIGIKNSPCITMLQVILYGMMFTTDGQLEIIGILDVMPMMAYIQFKMEHAQPISANSYIQMKIKGPWPPTIQFPFNVGEDRNPLNGEVIIQYKIKGCYIYLTMLKEGLLILFNIHLGPNHV